MVEITVIQWKDKTNDDNSNQGHQGEVSRLLLRLPEGGPTLHKGAGDSTPVFIIRLPDGDRPKTKEGIYPGAEGQDGRIIGKGSAGNGEISENGASMKGACSR